MTLCHHYNQLKIWKNVIDLLGSRYLYRKKEQEKNENEKQLLNKITQFNLFLPLDLHQLLSHLHLVQPQQSKKVDKNDDTQIFNFN